MSGFNFNPKISAEMQSRIGSLSKHDRFHSHAVAKVDPNGKTIGSTNKPEAFSERRERDLDRAHIRNYSQSRIGIFAHKPGMRRKPVNGSAELTRIQQSPQDRRQESNARSYGQFGQASQPNAKPQPTFREPPSRGFNPYS